MDDLDTVSGSGFYRFDSKTLSIPISNLNGFVMHMAVESSSIQLIIPAGGSGYSSLYKRRYADGMWSDWATYKQDDSYMVTPTSTAIESNSSLFQVMGSLVAGNINIKTSETAESIQIGLPAPKGSGFIVRQQSFDKKWFRISYNTETKIWDLTYDEGSIPAGTWIRFPVMYIKAS